MRLMTNASGEMSEALKDLGKNSHPEERAFAATPLAHNAQYGH